MNTLAMQLAWVLRRDANEMLKELTRQQLSEWQAFIKAGV